MQFPFVPKSTAHLEPGQFWSIPLGKDRFACGRVLQLKMTREKRDPRLFLAGLMDWVSTMPPTGDLLSGHRLLKQGEVHVKTIAENGGQILGFRTLLEDGIEPGYFLDQSPGTGCKLLHGYETIGSATREQQEKYPVFSTWGYGVIRILAEKHFGSRIG
jgi:hypothetical protein